MGPATNVVFAVIAANLVGAGALLSGCSGERDATPATPRQASIEPKAPQLAVAAATVAMPQAPPLPPPLREDARDQLHRLLAQGSPRDLFRAYGLLARCVHARDFERFVGALPVGVRAALLRAQDIDATAQTAAACGDFTAQELDERLALAAGAAELGVAGAASAWVEEGPFGDPSALRQRPDDPVVVAWAQQAIARVQAAARRSEVEAISQFGLLCLNWELDDVARVRLLVDAGTERRREERLGARQE